MKYTIRCVLCGAYGENAYLLLPEGRRDCLLIDPGDNLPGLEEALAGLSLRGILLTHGHFDHMLSAEPLQRISGAKVYVAREDGELLSDAYKCAYDAACSALPCPENLAWEPLSENLSLCGMTFSVLPTPGHTEGSVCFYDSENALLFAGDTLFRGGFGRMDLYGGSRNKMLASLNRLFALPEATRVFSGHGEETTIGEEKRRYRL